MVIIKTAEFLELKELPKEGRFIKGIKKAGVWTITYSIDAKHLKVIK